MDKWPIFSTTARKHSTLFQFENDYIRWTLHQINIASDGHRGLVIDTVYDFQPGITGGIEIDPSRRERRSHIIVGFSNWIGVTSGVPQGSIFGPLLFLIYEHDTLEGFESYLRMFANDTRIIIKAKNVYSCHNLQIRFGHIRGWLMKFNPTKFEGIRLDLVKGNLVTTFTLQETNYRSVRVKETWG